MPLWVSLEEALKSQGWASTAASCREAKQAPGCAQHPCEPQAGRPADRALSTLVHGVNLEHLILSHLIRQLKTSLLTTQGTHFETLRWRGPSWHFSLKEKWTQSTPAHEPLRVSSKRGSASPHARSPRVCTNQKGAHKQHRRVASNKDLSARSHQSQTAEMYLKASYCTK